MAYDILFGSNNETIGMATTLIDNPKEMAEALGKQESDVYHGRYKVLNGKFIKSRDGQPYTYWSMVGPIDIASIVALSEIKDMKAYFFKQGDEVVAFVDLENASEAGLPMETFIGEEDLAAMLLRDASGATDEFTKAVAVALDLTNP